MGAQGFRAIFGGTGSNRPFSLVHFVYVLNTQEVPSFLLLLERVHAGILMLACALSNDQRTNPPEYYHMICIGKTKCTREKGLL